MNIDLYFFKLGSMYKLKQLGSGEKYVNSNVDPAYKHTFEM